MQMPIEGRQKRKVRSFAIYKEMDLGAKRRPLIYIVCEGFGYPTPFGNGLSVLFTGIRAGGSEF
jgi:hypothetical protein